MEEEIKHKSSGIWLIVGYVLLVYGIIIMLTEAVSLVVKHPFITTLANIHPDLVWGAIMFVVGGLFVILGHRVRRKEGKNSGDE